MNIIKDLLNFKIYINFINRVILIKNLLILNNNKKRSRFNNLYRALKSVFFSNLVK